MTRPVRALLLVLAVLWQSAALFTPWVSSQMSAEVEHMASHADVGAHHHHADQSLHVDDDGPGFQHLHTDSGFHTLAIGHAGMPRLAVASAEARVEWVQRRATPPLLDGPLRPPKTFA